MVAPLFLVQLPTGSVMTEENFLCRDCGFSGPDSRFGNEVQCPHCRKRRIVLEAAWEIYKPEEVEQLKAEFSKSGKAS